MAKHMHEQDAKSLNSTQLNSNQLNSTQCWVTLEDGTRCQGRLGVTLKPEDSDAPGNPVNEVAPPTRCHVTSTVNRQPQPRT